jgi:hypothetical protein
MAGEIGLRQAYSTIKQAYATKGRNPVTTASDLKLILPINSAKTVFDFPVIVGDDQNNYPDAILLNRADAFTAVEMGIFIGKRVAATVAGQVAQTAFDWFTYPNTVEFAVTAGDAAALKPLFNAANINIAINNVQYLQNYSTLRMRRGPVTQAGLGNGVQVTATASNVLSTVTDSFNGEIDGFYPLVPTLQLSGTSKISVQLNLAQGLPVATTGIAQYCIMLAFRGFLSLGASNLNK